MPRKFTKNEIRSRFDNAANPCYGSKVPHWFPDYRYIYKTMIDVLEAYVPKAPVILDLGAGSGNLTKLVLKRLKKSNITLLDFSKNMLKEAELSLAQFKDRYKINIGDFFKCKLLLKEYNAVISSFAMHHGRTLNSYLNLYKKIFKALKKPGIFICADVVEGDTRIISKNNEAGWIGHMKKYYSRASIEKIMESYKREDSPISLRHHFKLMNRAGFSSCDVLWKKYNFGVYAGIK